MWRFNQVSQVLSFIRIWLGKSISKHWLRKWIKDLARNQISIAFGCASRIIQCFNKTSLRLCWYHLGRQRYYYINSWFTALAKLKAAKVILELPNYASSTDALKTLGWPTFFQERFVHRYIIYIIYIHTHLQKAPVMCSDTCHKKKVRLYFIPSFTLIYVCFCRMNTRHIKKKKKMRARYSTVFLPAEY